MGPTDRRDGATDSLAPLLGLAVTALAAKGRQSASAPSRPLTPDEIDAALAERARMIAGLHPPGASFRVHVHGHARTYQVLADGSLTEQLTRAERRQRDRRETR